MTATDPLTRTDHIASAIVCASGVGRRVMAAEFELAAVPTTSGD